MTYDSDMNHDDNVEIPKPAADDVAASSSTGETTSSLLEQKHEGADADEARGDP